jgi:ATP-dependent Clp protease adapter protein ClpS
MLNNSCTNDDIDVAHYKQHQHMTRNKNITKHQRMKAILVNDLVQLMEFPVAVAGGRI